MLILPVRLTGVSPLLMHGDKGANPLSEETIAHKRLTSKQKKTDDDQREIAKSEWRMSLYLSNDGKKVGIPSHVLFSTLVGGAKKNKLGTQVRSGVQIVEGFHPLRFEHEKSDIESLWDLNYVDCRSVKVGKNKIMRYRPVFRDWYVELQLAYDEAVVTEENLLMSFFNAGRYVGMCDFGPRCGGNFGRFEAAKI